MTSDLTFITNENDRSLLERFGILIKDTKFFDCLVGYFYTSGFYSLCDSLENTEKIRILIGIGTNRETVNLIEESKKDIQKTLSHKEAKEEFSNHLIREMNISEDSLKIENGIKKFIEWIKSGKLEIKAYPEEMIHAKLYIMTFTEGDRDVGRVITGSSNFTRSGLKDNIEFNVELKNKSDYDFALQKFNEMWKRSVDVSEKYVDVVKNKTWMNDDITPYDLYLKFLYEYLKEKINIDKMDIFEDYKPENFKDLEYQKDAVRDAKIKLEEYGGVFVSDVVGLGKTYICAMLAKQLDGRNLVIAPPSLIHKEDPGSWPSVFFDFGVRQTDFESIGNLEKIIERGTERYKNVFIDEAHEFRTQTTQMYENMAKICRGKRVILVSATPLNNTPMDILSQIKLFQNAHRSTLPNPKIRDLEKYFNNLQNRLKGLDRQKDKDEYLKIVQENAKEIRENILQYLMVRRTRSSIVKYYGNDMKKQSLRFPEVVDPEPIYYHFDKGTDKIFNETIELIAKEFKYSRYTPLLYLNEDIPQPEELSQKNMRKFMKVLLLKRLESSFFAFRKSIERFIYSYENFISEYEKGNVYVSKKYINKIFDFIENDNENAIQELIDEEKAIRYHSKNFKPDFIKDLKNDLKILKRIEEIWKDVKGDPKLETFIKILKNNDTLKKNKILVFTESKETAEYLQYNLNPKLANKIIVFSSESGDDVRKKVMQNFDARSRNPKDDYRILISTEILSQGVNLHRSNIVINYDIPWNPTRMIQRVGRINRVDTKFDKIHTYNFFPAGPINENIGLKELAEAKIRAFIEMLGNDARLLTDEEVKSHDLFRRLTSRKTITGEDEEDDPELKYLIFLRNIRDNDKDLFEKIKNLPKKARTARKYNESHNSLLTFFRKGKLRKIYQTNGSSVDEIDFLKAADILKADRGTRKEFIFPEFYEYLEKNKMAFASVFNSDEDIIKSSGGRSSETKMMRIVKALLKEKTITDEDEDYLRAVKNILEEGSLPKATIKKFIKSLEKETEPLKILAKMKTIVSKEFFQGMISVSSADTSGPKEVILSEYLIRGIQNG